MTSATAFICEELYFWHDNGSAVIEWPAGHYGQPNPHVETPESKRRMRNLLEVSGLLPQLKHLRAEPASTEQVLRFHTKRYLSELQAASARLGTAPFGDGSCVGHGSYEIAMLSAGGAIRALHEVASGQAKNAYCLNRPPGHHALADKAMGFCLLGNIPIALHHLFAESRIDRVAVVDWDVHHGNGTQAAFYDRADVLTISLHQDGNYPVDTGRIDEIGVGEGKGYNINIPLPPGTGTGGYACAMERIVLPALRRFQPDMIVVACGFDASVFDPMGRQMLTAASFGDMTRTLMEAADELCEGRLAMTHEGGYSEEYVPFCGLAVMEALTGIETDVDDPFHEDVSNFPQQPLQANQLALIEAVCSVHQL